MKIFFYSLTIFSLLLFTQCNGKPDRPESVLNETQKVYDGTDLNTPSTVATPPPTNEPPQNADGVWHYTCSNGCPGGAGSAQACATCGSILAHNSAYHTGGNNTPGATATAGNQITFDPNNPATPPTGLPPGAIDITPVNGAAPSAAVTPEPPQNAAGVWHYICSNGCAGGGGSASPCGTCGNTLAHNSAYHQ